jgi:hypothetical protein
MSKASDTQVGGHHYKYFAIQPAVFCEVNKLSHLESNVVKRMCRWKTKGDMLADLRKAQHEIDLLIEIHEVDVIPRIEAAQAERQHKDLCACHRCWPTFNEGCEFCQALLTREEKNDE